MMLTLSLALTASEPKRVAIVAYKASGKGDGRNGAVDSTISECLFICAAFVSCCCCFCSCCCIAVVEPPASVLIPVPLASPAVAQLASAAAVAASKRLLLLLPAPSMAFRPSSRTSIILALLACRSFSSATRCLRSFSSSYSTAVSIVQNQQWMKSRMMRSMKVPSSLHMSLGRLGYIRWRVLGPLGVGVEVKPSKASGTEAGYNGLGTRPAFGPEATVFSNIVAAVMGRFGCCSCAAGCVCCTPLLSLVAGMASAAFALAFAVPIPIPAVRSICPLSSPSGTSYPANAMRA